MRPAVDPVPLTATAAAQVRRLRTPSVPARLLMLHPAVLILAVWAVAVAFWATAPASVVEDSTVAGQRAASGHAIAYFAGCLGAFVLASVLAGVMAKRPASGAGPVAPLDHSPARALRQAALGISMAAVFGGFVWFLRAGMLVGGPIELLRAYGGGSGVALKLEVVGPAQLAPVTTMVHLSPAAVGALLYYRQTRGWQRTERLLFAGLIAVTVVRATLFAERLAAMAVVSAGIVTVVICAQQLDGRRFLRWVVIGACVSWVAWTTGEFFRSFRDTRPPGQSTAFTPANYLSSWSYSSNRLGAYVFSAIDNGIIIVEEWPTQVFPRQTSGTLVAMGVPAAGTDAPDLFNSSLDPEFTGKTLFGSFFMDARDFGILLAALFGAFFGFAWRAAARGSVAGIVMYAATVQVVLDSYRMNYLLGTAGLVAIFGALTILAATETDKRRGVRGSPAARGVPGKTRAAIGPAATSPGLVGRSPRPPRRS